ncbi:MAG TPA: AEC family transporter [Bacteriovoracaceae bacterium]|nr:AEC family transporter [Bacteriovoracaceae bacterium]
MSNLYLIGICLVIGVLLQRLRLLPKDAHTVLNIIILHVPLPAMVLLSIPGIDWDLALLGLCFVAWIIFFFAFFFFRLIGKRLHWERGTIGCLILTAGLGNTAFVGFPVIEALYGKESLKLALLLDQPGTFLIVSSLGIWTAVLYSSGRMLKRDLARKVLLFPPFVAFFLSVVLSACGWQATGDLKSILERLASILTPLALISVGLQLRPRDLKPELKYLGWGLAFKLFLAPLMIFLIYSALEISPLVFNIAVMEAAMAPMITASILAASHNLNPRLAGLMVGVGVPISFLSLGLWFQVMRIFN